ncbi:MAG: PIN domain-containing protein [Pyrinomonadaceae bacterium]
MNAVDTNVLIYARDPRHPLKHQTARQLTAQMLDGGLLWQVACEFIAASRKLTEVGYTQAQAWRELEQLRQLWKLIVPSEQILTHAERLTSTHNFSFWDSLLVAACIEGGVTRLYTEDFDSSISKAIGVEIINPF